MLSLEYIRQNVDKVKKTLVLKNRQADVDLLLKLDEENKSLIAKINGLREERNKLAKAKERSEALNKRGKEIKEELKVLEEKQTDAAEKVRAIQLSIPNIPYDEVPEGKSEADNKEVKRVGEQTKFTFAPKSHIDLVKALDIADLERGVKVSGFRGYFLKGKLAMLHFALLWYVYQKMFKKGYIPLIAPSLVKEFTFFGNGQFPWGREEVYNLEKDDLYLAGTAEVPVTAYYANETLNEKDLPVKFYAFSPCFRREIGSYGKDTKGLYRVHEFAKVEQVIIGAADDVKARELHEELQKNVEEIITDLGLPYRVLLMCTGDMGEPQAKKYDTEVWMPCREGYGEAASNSIMTDYQARRLNIRYKDKEGNTKFAYTFNNTALASPRILIAILENCQQADGSVKVPQVLQALCGFTEISK